jgi:hypothetical protein
MNNLDLMRLRMRDADQQERMIADKRKTLDKVFLYSYQGADVRDLNDKTETIYKALINPNSLKPDYDDKVISIPFESNFSTGTIFSWERTQTKWIIYLQDLTELAYFKGDVRKCNYVISWMDEDKQIHTSYAATRGPVETKISTTTKNGIVYNTPNHTLSILLPQTEDTVKYFKRYAKFYLQGLDKQDDLICWRVEGFDYISTPGILEITAVEYYANEFEDDIEAGIAGGLVEPDPEPETRITGDTFIYPKMPYTYTYEGDEEGEWVYDTKLPIKVEAAGKSITITWLKNYSGQFDLTFGSDTRAIVVESIL